MVADKQAQQRYRYFCQYVCPFKAKDCEHKCSLKAFELYDYIGASSR